MDRWSLKELYTSYDSIEFQNDMKNWENSIERFEQIANGTKEIYKGEPPYDEEQEKQLLLIVTMFENMTLLQDRLSAFIQLQMEVNTQDAVTASWMDKFMFLYSKIGTSLALVQKFVGTIINLQDLINKNKLLSEYSYFLYQMKEDAAHTLSEEGELIFGKMNLSGGMAWRLLRDCLVSILEVEYQGDKLTLPAVRNLAYSSDGKVRKEAYLAELKSYEKISDAISYSLNNIKMQMNTECELRGYPSALDKALYDADMSHTTLDAMFAQIKLCLPKFRQYLRRKAELLGYQNGLPFYELFAPLGENHKTFTIEETKTYLVKHFSGFSSDLAQMIERAYEEDWIDWFPRKGKAGGAFCYDLPFIGQSRILTNFDGTLSSLVTLAHELGHAYHGMHTQDHRPLNRTYGMPVAETASTFNETVIMNALIHEASGEEKLGLMESRLQDLTQVIVDIYSRFLFETEVFEKRKNGFVNSTELKGIMLNAQKEAYGDGLDPEYLHPYMWINKGHYYSETLSFYNFPYAFGALFANGLYKKYEAEGAAFVSQYQRLLHETTVNSVEGIAKMADIDLSSEEFWNKSLTNIANMIDQFIEFSMK